MQPRHPKEKRQAIRAPIGKKKGLTELHPLDPHPHYAALQIGVIANFGTKCV